MNHGLKQATAFQPRMVIVPGRLSRGSSRLGVPVWKTTGPPETLARTAAGGVLARPGDNKLSQIVVGNVQYSAAGP